MNGIVRHLGVALAVLIGFSGCAMAAASFNCAKASTRAEKAICANPPLSAADAAMAQTYRSLLGRLAAAQRPGLVRSQQEWLRARDRNCGYDRTPAGFSRCLLTTTGFRTKILSIPTVVTANGAKIAPNVFHQDQPGVYEITAIYPSAEGGNPGATADFNRLVRNAAVGSRDFKAFYARNMLSIPNTFSEWYRLESLGGNLVSLLLTTDSFSGGAHGIAERQAMLIDLASGRKLGLDALLKDPARAVPAISNICKEKLRAEAKQQGWADMLWIDDPKMDADPKKEVKDPSNWFVQPGGVEILFGEYTIGPYAIGLHQCRLGYGELAPWLNKKGVLADLAK